MANFILLGNSSNLQMFGCIIQTQNRVIVIDGGTAQDSKQLTNYLIQHANSHVDAWFFTHPHHDHIGCFVDVCKNGPKITVDKIYYNFPDYATIQSYVHTESELTSIADFFELTCKKQTHKVSVNNTFIFDDVAIRVLRVYNPAITVDFINNSSTVYRIDGKNGSFLILGDLGIEGGEEMMKNCPLSLMETEYTQMAHHGQDGVSKEFYDYIKPKKCIWATPDWLWDNDAGNGYDTGPWQTVRTREWVAALGATEHIIEKDGMQKIEF